MGQESPICRFCLDSKNGIRNALITPCECKGSLQYVHEVCLAKWRRVNPARNGERCMLCLELYKKEYFDTFEIIPDQNTLVIFLLRFPFVISISTNYVGLFLYILMPRKISVETYFEEYQYWSQVAYFLLFFFCWRVKQKERYWQRWLGFSTLVLASIQIICNLLIHNHVLVAALPLNFLLGLYWRNHVQILHDINGD
jgi:hypothetical protein